MNMDVEPSRATAPAGSQREIDLEAKLQKRTMLLALFVALAATELLVMVEMIRQAG